MARRQEKREALEAPPAVRGLGLAQEMNGQEVNRVEERHYVEKPAFKHTHGICGRHAERWNRNFSVIKPDQKGGLGVKASA